MKIGLLKHILTVLILIVSVESLSYFTGLPFTTGDVILFPLSVIIIVLGIKSLFASEKKKLETYGPKSTLMRLVGSFVVVVLALFLGLWSLYEGGRNPLALYTSVKGAVHGYTLLSLGLLISGYSVYFMSRFALKIKEAYLIYRNPEK